MRLVNISVLGVLLLTPFMNIYEVQSLITGAITDHSNILTPLYIKVLKDVGMLGVFAAGFFVSICSMRINRNAMIMSGILLCMILPACVLSLAYDWKIALAGIRWILPFLLVPSLVGHISRNGMSSVAKVLAFIFLGSFSLQIYQIFFASSWFGISVFGLPNRLGGFFIIPSTAAFFSCACWYFSYYFLQEGLARSAMLFLTPFSVLLTSSGTGLLVIILSIALARVGKKLILYSPVFLVLLLMLWATLPIVTGRADLFISPTVRLEIFLKTLDEAVFLPGNFGIGTNTSVLLSRNFAANESMIHDSFITAVIVNTGYLGVLCFGAMFFRWVAWLMVTWYVEGFVFTAIWGIFSCTVQFTECFPMNLLFSVILAYYIPQIRLPKNIPVLIPNPVKKDKEGNLRLGVGL